MPSYVPTFVVSAQSGDVFNGGSLVAIGSDLVDPNFGFNDHMYSITAAQALPGSLPETGTSWIEGETPDLPAGLAWLTVAVAVQPGLQAIVAEGREWDSEIWELVTVEAVCPDGARYPFAFTQTAGEPATQPKISRAVTGETFDQIIERHVSAKLRVRLHWEKLEDDALATKGTFADAYANIESVSVTGETFDPLPVIADLTAPDSQIFDPRFRVTSADDVYPHIARAMMVTMRLGNETIVDAELCSLSGGFIDFAFGQTLEPDRILTVVQQVIYDRYGDHQRVATYETAVLVPSVADPAVFDVTVLPDAPTEARIRYDKPYCRIERRHSGGKWLTIAKGGLEQLPLDGELDYPPLNVDVEYRAWHGVLGSTMSVPVTVMVSPVVVDAWILTDVDTNTHLAMGVSSVQEIRQSTSQRTTGNLVESVTTKGIVTPPTYVVTADIKSAPIYTQLMNMLESDHLVLRGPHGQYDHVLPTGPITSNAIRNAEPEGSAATSLIADVLVSLAVDTRWS